MPSRASAAPAFVYAPDLGAIGSEVELSVAESHYVARVCRARAGDALDATNGRGGVAGLVVVAVEPRVRARVERVEQRTRGRRTRMLCGAPEGQRDDWMVEKLVELGVECWVPIDCERGRWRVSARRRERWQRLAVAALKQSRSAFLMEIDDPVDLKVAAEGLAPEALRWLATADGSPARPPLGAGFLVGVVGPSAGLTGTERRWLEGQGFAPVSLAPSRLRTETAAVSLAAVWLAMA